MTRRARLRSVLGGQGPVAEVERDLTDAHAAAGGEGAPLDPVFHAGLAAGLERPLAVGASSAREIDGALTDLLPSL